MTVVRLAPVWMLLALAACGTDPTSLALDDPQEVAERSIPTHPAEDGEATRLQPRPDPLPEDVLADRLERAHAAFIGEVVGIEHADVALKGRGPMPHTFVTYRVDHAVKGGSPGEEVTLRFLGGSAADGVRSLSVSGIPEFDLGERDLLFVGDDNGRSACPLVDCESGRLPVIGDQITAVTGHLLVTLPDGRTRFAEAGAVPDAVHGEQLELRPEVEPIGTPMSRSELVGRLAQAGPALAPLSVTPTAPTR